MTNRVCTIVSGGVGCDQDAGDDGAYDLLDVSGTPEEIGKAIAESLAGFDVCAGREATFGDKGQDVYLTVTIRVSQEWRDCGEGPWDTEDEARRFAEAEVGDEWQLREMCGLWHVVTKTD